MSFADSLTRLQLALEGRDDRQRGRRDERVVRTEDLRALLRDHERLDAEARMLYPPHVERCRKALAGLHKAMFELSDAMEPFDGPMRKVIEQESKKVRFRE